MKKNAIALSFFAAFLSSCGFEPLHRHDGSLSTLENKNIRLNIKGLEGYAYFHFQKRFSFELKRRLGAMTQPLGVIIQVSPNVRSIGIGRDATVLRKQVRYEVQYRVHQGDHTWVGHSATHTSFNQDPTSEFSNLSSLDAAQERALSTLAERTAHAIAAHFKMPSSQLSTTPPLSSSGDAS
jgi:hypothetical protein